MIGLCKTLTGYFFDLFRKNNKGHFYLIYLYLTFVWI